MSITKLLIDEDARKSIFKGMEKVYKMVSATMGAEGRIILIHKDGFPTYATKDGVTVARNIEIENTTEQCGADIIVSAAQRTNQTSGDGTSATTVLTYSIVKNALRDLSYGKSANSISKELEKEVDKILKEIQKFRKPISDNKEIEHIANIALNGDKEIASLIRQAIDKVGRNGVVTAQKSRRLKSELEIIEGMHLKTGPYMINFLDPATREAILEDCYVLCYNGHLRNFLEIKKILDEIVREKQHGKVRSVLIFVNEANYDPIRDLLLNKEKGILNSCLIRTPFLEDAARLEILQDIALYTGGKVIDEYANAIQKASIKDLGYAKKVIVNKYATMIFDANTNKEELKKRVELIKKDIEEIEDDEALKQRLKQRIARLTTGIAIIHVGAATEAELTEKKYRVDDALQSVRSAIESGIVPGGGVALLRASEQIDNVILKEALKEPIKSILNNAGVNEYSIIEKILENGDPFYGFDVSENKYCNLYTEGIIDAYKVIEETVINSVSAAIIAIKTQGIIYNERSEKDGKK